MRRHSKELGFGNRAMGEREVRLRRAHHMERLDAARKVGNKRSYSQNN